MELRQLRYLLTVAHEGTFTRAAEQCFVSQSALSQQIQLLEHEVGTRLIDRSRRGARLTTAGEILCHHAQRVLAELDDAVTAINELEGLQRGELRIGAVQTVNAYLIPHLVAEFTQRYPNIKIHVDELAADDIETRLKSGSLQLGISFVPAIDDELDSAPLFDEELVLIVPCAHPLADRPRLQVTDLHGLRMALLSERFCTRRLWDSTARSAGIEADIRLEANTVDSVLSIVIQTGMATVLPALALSSQNHDGELVGIPLENPKPTRSVGLLWSRSAYLCAATRQFAELARTNVFTNPSDTDLTVESAM